MKRKTWFVGSFFLLVILFSPVSPLAAPYYEGKTINIIVGFPPGGGYDRMARLLAKYLPQYIPGNPTIIVQNMPGASSIIAANYIYNIAKPDGLTIGSSEAGLTFAQLLKSEGIRFDLRKYSWIGSTSIETALFVIRTDLPYKTVDDLRMAKEPIHLASTGPANQNHQFPILLKEFLGLNFKMIVYPSSAANLLAIERKEVDGRGGLYSALKPLIDRGLVRPLIRGRVTEPETESLPVDEDLTTNTTGKTLMAIRSTPERFGKPYAAPPGTPADVMNILRDAFAKVIKDPELKEDSKKNMLTVKYAPADEYMKMLNYVLNQPEDTAKEFSKYIKF